MKTHRRQHGLPAHLDMSIRFTSLFIIAIAVCEFSGLSQAVADAYTAVTLRFSAPPVARAPLRHHLDVPGAVVRPIPPTTSETTTSLSHSRNRAALYRLYDMHPDTKVSHMLTTRRFETPQPKPPTFALETFWSEQDFDHKVCRVHNACIGNDGTLLVHPNLKQNAGPLRECGVQKLGYLKSPSDFVTNDSTAGFDLFGASTARYHIPHFLTDVLPLLYASELIWPSTKHLSTTSDCVLPSQASCEVRTNPKDLNAALFVDDRVLRMTVSAWVPQLVAMLPGQPYMFTPETLFTKGDSGVEDKRCFRSVVSFSRHTHLLRSSEWFGEGNGMFDRFGLSRHSVYRPPVRQHKGAPKCQVHIVIINRHGWERRYGMLLGRDLVNVNEIKARIEHDAPKTRKPTVDPTVSVEYFENKTFAQQVELMQKADVIVGVHGAGLSNMLFARKDTPMMEVLPFTYYAGPFSTVAESLYLKYAYMIAEPDTKTFLECIEIRARKVGDSGISRRAKELWVEALRRRKLDGELEFLKTHLMTDPRGSNMKVCARTQRLKVDAVEMSKRVLQMAQSVCGGAVEI